MTKHLIKSLEKESLQIIQLILLIHNVIICMDIIKGDPEFAREINRTLILDYLRKKEKAPRIEIARSLNLTKGTTSKIKTKQQFDSQFV